MNLKVVFNYYEKLSYVILFIFINYLVLSSPLGYFFYSIFSSFEFQEEHLKIFLFLFTRKEKLISFLSKREIYHLIDVSNILNFISVILMINILIIIIIKKSVKTKVTYRKIDIYLIASLLLLILIFWNPSFNFIHKLLFKVNYTFPSKAMLIKMYYKHGKSFFLFSAIISYLMLILELVIVNKIEEKIKS